MRVQDQDIYHGIALAQIVRHKSFKALNHVLPKQGHYMINSDRHLLVKYRTSDDNGLWQFTFKPEEISALKKMGQKSNLVFLCLVCGQSTICALSLEEIKTLLVIKKRNDQQSITVEFPIGLRLRVRGTNGKLPKTVPHNAFPQKLFTGI